MLSSMSTKRIRQKFLKVNWKKLIKSHIKKIVLFQNSIFSYCFISKLAQIPLFTILLLLTSLTGLIRLKWNDWELVQCSGEHKGDDRNSAFHFLVVHYTTVHITDSAIIWIYCSSQKSKCADCYSLSEYIAQIQFNLQGQT